MIRKDDLRAQHQRPPTPRKTALGGGVHDSDEVRFALLVKGVLPVIPPKSNRREPIATDFRAYKDRNRIERMSNKLKQFRRVATRYDKTAASYLGFLAIASAKLWLPGFVNRA